MSYDTRHRWIPVLMAAGVLAAVPLGARPAEAQRRKSVVVLPFDGPASRRARNGVLRGLKRRVRFVSVRKYRALASRHGDGPRTAEGMAAACQRMGCHAIVVGRVKRRRRRRFTLQVTVVNAATGERIGRRAATVRGTRRLVAAGVKVGRRILRLIRRGDRPQAAPEPAPAPAPTPTPPPSQPPGARQPGARQPADTSDIPVFQPKNASPAAEEDAEGVSLAAEADSGPRANLVGIGVGIGAVLRDFTLEGDPSLPPHKYEGGMYPEIVLAADVYPLAPFVDNAANGVGLGLTYSRHLSISTTRQDPETDTEAAVDSSSWELLLDLKFRYIFWDSETSPSVAGFFGYGMRDFELAQNVTLTSFNYQFVRFGLRGIAPILTPLFAVEAGFDVRPVMKVGQEAVDSFGDKQGALAWSVRAGLSGRTEWGVTYFATFELLRFSTEFAGLDEGVQIRDDWPDRADPTTGSDQFIRFWGGVGYAY